MGIKPMSTDEYERRILEYLKEKGEGTVKKIAKDLKIHPNTASIKTRLLQAKGLIQGSERGRAKVYRLKEGSQ